ncbi:Hpt domain-containing protein [Pseudarthrobacter enclensis]|uniref:Hpt domain-containing protein n=1 Tax=Pseudarthrobacter enclensis TaxID=993070 RepID=UPI0036798F74
MTPTTSPSAELSIPAGRPVPPGLADGQPPLVDPSVLERLRTELEDCSGYTQVFVAGYIECLPQRIERLRLALTTGDMPGAVDAVLSLKTSSQMVGAELLASLAQELEAELRSAGSADPSVALPQQAARFLGPLNRCSIRTIRSLASRGRGLWEH